MSFAHITVQSHVLYVKICERILCRGVHDSKGGLHQRWSVKDDVIY